MGKAEGTAVQIQKGTRVHGLPTETWEYKWTATIGDVTGELEMCDGSVTIGKRKLCQRAPHSYPAYVSQQTDLEVDSSGQSLKVDIPELGIDDSGYDGNVALLDKTINLLTTTADGFTRRTLLLEQLIALTSRLRAKQSNCAIKLQSLCWAQ